MDAWTVKERGRKDLGLFYDTGNQLTCNTKEPDQRGAYATSSVVVSVFTFLVDKVELVLQDD